MPLVAVESEADEASTAAPGEPSGCVSGSRLRVNLHVGGQISARKSPGSPFDVGLLSLREPLQGEGLGPSAAKARTPEAQKCAAEMKTCPRSLCGHRLGSVGKIRPGSCSAARGTAPVR